MSTDVSHAQDQAGFDLDEDLFDFGGVAGASEAQESEEDLEQIFASFREAEPAEELLPVPTAKTSTPAAPAAAAHAPAHVETPSPAPHSAPSASTNAAAHAARAEPNPKTTARDTTEPVRALEPAPRTGRWAGLFTGRLSKGVVIVALSVTVLNSLLSRSGCFSQAWKLPGD